MMKKILLVSDGVFHPPLLARFVLHRALARLDGLEFSRTRSLEKLPPALDDFAALVIYLHHKELSDRALAALQAYVSGGGGLLGVHSATASFKEQPAYFDILGGRFTGHGPVEPFEVTPVHGSKIFGGIPAFGVVDELYLHELSPSITVHFTAKHQDQEAPVVWTTYYGAGRVCYAVPGHRAAAMRNPVYQKILQRGLAWAAGVDGA